jgi:hypothetical protein
MASVITGSQLEGVAQKVISDQCVSNQFRSQLNGFEGIPGVDLQRSLPEKLITDLLVTDYFLCPALSLRCQTTARRQLFAFLANTYATS